MAIKRVESFEPRGKGALQAYLGQALMNRIRNGFRRVARRPAADALDEQAPSAQTSPLEAAIRQERLERYEVAVSRLTEEFIQLFDAQGELIQRTAFPRTFLGIVSPVRRITRISISEAPNDGDDVTYDDFVCVR